MSRDAVAVVIPCHNGAATIEAAVRSALDQSHAVEEVVVVDDGSTDDGAELAARIGARCLRQRQGGPASARNAGVGATTAPWLAFLDADDTFAVDKIERQLDSVGGDPDIALCCSDAWVVRDGERIGRKNAGRRVPLKLEIGDLIAANPIICSSVLVRRQAILAVGGFDEDPVLIATEDYDLWLRIAATGSGLRYLDAPLIDYRVAASSLSDDERFMRGVDQIMEKVRLSGVAPPAAIARRCASVRLDAAYQRIQQGRRTEARQLLGEARQLGGWSVPWVRMWLRTWWPGIRATGEQ